MESLRTAIAERSSTLLPFFVVVIGIYFSNIAFAGTKETLPWLGKEFGNALQRQEAYRAQNHDLYQKGYALFKDKAFRLTTSEGERVVVPRDFVKELRDLPDKILDLREALNQFTLAPLLGMGDPKLAGFVAKLVRADLTRAIPRLHHGLTDETKRTIADELPQSEDWKQVKMHRILLRIIAIVSGSVFIGPEYCRDETYLDASIMYTVHFSNAMIGLKKWHPKLRWFGRLINPAVKNLYQERKKACAFLIPVVQNRRAAIAAGDDVPDNVLTWMCKKADSNNLTDENLANLQLNLSMAAIHSTAITLLNILFDLVACPEGLVEIRDEISRVLADHDGEMSSRTLFHMKLLDSAMKESTRLNPGHAVRFERYLQQSVTLKDGTVLPGGVVLEVPHEVSLLDPKRFQNPEIFDPHRFFDLRSGTAPNLLGYDNLERYQFITTTKDFMHFGYGRHACPGRFFAANEIKLIMVNILLGYDVRMPDGLTERYPNQRRGIDALPDFSKDLLVRKL
ncbi:ent-kaurene oxidase [Xylariaceae sp. FL1019]|nr:ent-kaurene oxidase [Xylariaceae sp. FL1019]